MQIGNRSYYFGRDMRPIRILTKSLNFYPIWFILNVPACFRMLELTDDVINMQISNWDEYSQHLK